MSTPEQFLAAQTASFGTVFGVAAKTFEGIEKFVELNLQVGKASLAEIQQSTRSALSVKDVQELLTLQAAAVQPAAEKLASYARHVYDIAAATNADIGAIAEQTAAESQKSFASLFDTAVKSAPAGSENAVALVKSAVAAASNAYESVQKAVKQVTDAAEANFQAATATAIKTTTPAANGRVKRAA